MIKLTYHKARNCWKKVVNGKTIYCPIKVKGKTDKTGLKKSQEWFINKLSQLNSESPELASVGSQISPGSPTVNFKSITASQSQALVNGLNGTNGTATKNIGELIEKFASTKEHDAKINKRSMDTFRQLRNQLRWFDQTFLQTVLPEWGSPVLTEIDSLEENFLQTYRQYNELCVQNGEIKPNTANHRLSFLKRLIRYAYEIGSLERLPRNLDSQTAKIDVGPLKTAEKHFTRDELRGLYKATTDETRLYMLFGLFCGFYPSDIATTTHGMLDWSGQLVRYRHKTRRKSQVPVSFYLPQFMLKLIREQMTNPWESIAWPEYDLSECPEDVSPEKWPDDKLLLLNSNHLPVWQNKPTKRDNVGDAFKRVRTKYFGPKPGLSPKIAPQPNDNRGFSSLRKTAGQFILDKFGKESPFCVDLWLGHAEQGMRKHYVVNNTWEDVHAAGKYLEEYLDLENLE